MGWIPWPGRAEGLPWQQRQRMRGRHEVQPKWMLGDQKWMLGDSDYGDSIDRWIFGFVMHTSLSCMLLSKKHFTHFQPIFIWLALTNPYFTVIWNHLCLLGLCVRGGLWTEFTNLLTSDFIGICTVCLFKQFNLIIRRRTMASILAY